MIYRIAEAADRAAARQGGSFASPDLAAEGFVHFSERHQVQGVADRYYAEKTGHFTAKLLAAFREKTKTDGEVLFA